MPFHGKLENKKKMCNSLIEKLYRQTLELCRLNVRRRCWLSKKLFRYVDNERTLATL
jgi:hypothetical protein